MLRQTPKTKKMKILIDIYDNMSHVSVFPAHDVVISAPPCGMGVAVTTDASLGLRCPLRQCDVTFIYVITQSGAAARTSKALLLPDFQTALFPVVQIPLNQRSHLDFHLGPLGDLSVGSLSRPV